MDSLQEALLTIFVFASLEGWNDLVYSYLDSGNADTGPQLNQRPWAAAFHLPVIYQGAFICVQLFVGVIFMNYVIAGV